MNKILILLIILISTLNQSQLINGVILNHENNPIKGARIGIEHEEKGDLSDSNGKFQLDFSNVDKTKKLKIIVREYEPYESNILDFINSNHTIRLSDKILDIEEVKMSPKKYKLKNFGTSNSKRSYCGYNSEKQDKIFHEYAIKIENNKRLKVKKINLNITEINLNAPATLIFDIQNSSNGFPDDSKSLTNETVKITINNEDVKDNKVSIDVSDKNIWTNEDFFVTVRIEDGLKGNLSIGGNIYAFSKSTYYRNYYGEWKKFSVGSHQLMLML